MKITKPEVAVFMPFVIFIQHFMYNFKNSKCLQNRMKLPTEKQFMCVYDIMTNDYACSGVFLRTYQRKYNKIFLKYLWSYMFWSDFTTFKNYFYSITYVVFLVKIVTCTVKINNLLQNTWKEKHWIDSVWIQCELVVAFQVYLLFKMTNTQSFDMRMHTHVHMFTYVQYVRMLFG